MDTTEMAGARRYVALDLCSKVQRESWDDPMEYLTRWRMILSGGRLKNSDDSVSVIALSLGYESESAFGKAFKRIMGCSPKQYSHGSSSTPRSLPAPEGSENQQMELAAVR